MSIQRQQVSTGERVEYSDRVIKYRDTRRVRRHSFSTYRSRRPFHPGSLCQCLGSLQLQNEIPSPTGIQEIRRYTSKNITDHVTFADNLIFTKIYFYQINIIADI